MRISLKIFFIYYKWIVIGTIFFISILQLLFTNTISWSPIMWFQCHVDRLVCHQQWGTDHLGWTLVWACLGGGVQLPSWVRLFVTCPSLSPWICSNSCSLRRWCYLTISSSATLFSFCLLIFPSSWVFSSESTLCIRWPRFWSFSFSISLSNEYSWLILSDWLVWSPCSPRDSKESFRVPQFKSISSSVLSLPYGPTRTPIHDYWKNHSFDYTDLLFI